MGSVSPFDSISLGVESVGSGGTQVNGPGELSAVLGGLAQIGGVSETGLLSIVRSWTSAYHAYLERVKSHSYGVDDRAGTSVRGKGSSSSASSTAGMRYVTPSHPGYCYLLAIRREYRQAAAARLKADPSFDLLLQLPDGWLATEAELSGLYVVGKAGTYHLQGVPAEGAMSCKAVFDSLRSGEICDSIVSPESVLGSEELSEFMSELAGLKLAGQASADVDLVSKSAAMHGAEAKARLRMLEAVGDAALTHVCARACLSAGVSVQQYQTARAIMTNNSTLSAVFVKRFPQARFSFPSGVDPGIGTVGAKTLEAVLGVIDLHGGQQAVAHAVEKLELVELISLPTRVAKLGRAPDSVSDLSTLELEVQQGKVVVGAHLSLRGDGLVEYEEIRERERIKLCANDKVCGEMVVAPKVMQVDDRFAGYGRYVLVGGVYDAGGCRVDASNVLVGLDLWGREIKCVEKGGTLIQLAQGGEFARASTNADSMCEVIGVGIVEIMWPSSVRGLEVWRPLQTGEIGSDGFIEYDEVIEPDKPFQILSTEWLGATLLSASDTVKIKMGCVSGYGLSVVVHRGCLNVCVLGAVVSATSQGHLKIGGVIDSYAWDCFHED